MTIDEMIAQAREQVNKADADEGKAALIPDKKWSDLPRSLWNEVTGWAEKSVDAAGELAQSYNGVDVVPNETDGGSIEPTPEQQKKISQAGRNFFDQAVVPPVFLGAIIPNPLQGVFGVAAMGIMGRDLIELVPAQIEQARKESDGSPVSTGLGRTASMYLGIDAMGRALKDPKALEQQFLTAPIGTAGEYFPAYMFGRGVYKGGKWALKKGAKSGEAAGANMETPKPANETMGLKTEQAGVITDKQTGVVRERTAAEAGLPVEEYKAPTSPYVGAKPDAVLPSEKAQTGEAIWRNKEGDVPIKITGEAGELNGRKYVNVEGSNTAIPLDEVVFKDAKPTVESRLASKVDAATPEAKIQIGATVQEVDIPLPKGKTAEALFPAESEARYQAATKGVQPESFVSGVKDFLQKYWNQATRQYEHLPAGAEFAPLKFDLNVLQHAKAVSGERAGRILQGLTIDMKHDKGAFDLFQRKVLLDDLAKTEGALPFGFTRETLLEAKAKVDAAIEGNATVLQALADRKGIWEEVKANYFEAMKDIGFDVTDRMKRDDYFHHQVLAYANGNGVTGTGSKLKTPTGRGFLRERKGSELDINANYLQAEFHVLSQMLYDTKVAEIIKGVDKNYSIRPDLVKLFGKEWRNHIPEGYTTWQPREGSSFYLAHSIPEKLVKQLLEGGLEELGVSAEQLKTIKAKGAPFKEFVVKEEVAKTLDNITKITERSAIGGAIRKATGLWKQWVLSSPTRIVKFNTRNMFGDSDAVAGMNPRAFGKAKQAANELYQTIYGDRSMTPEMKAWFERGGMETTLNIQELSEINKLKMFKDFSDNNPNKIKAAWDKYWEGANQFNSYREAILRYANYLDYVEQMKANGGKPKNFGASKPEEIMALKSIEDRAFKLSNEVMGAYDSVSVLGKNMRETVAPFWSWNETNFKRYSQFFKNQYNDGDYAAIGKVMGRKLGVAAVTAPIAVGKFAVKASAMWAMLQAYNLTMFPEEEAELSKEEQSRPHIILGRDEQGKVRYFNRLGAFGDFLEWFGLDTPAKDVKDLLNGTRSLGEIAKDMAMSPVNKLAQSATPFVKTPFEFATGKTLYPDVSNPRSIKDVPAYVASQAGLTKEFKALSRSEAGEAMGMIPRPDEPYTIPNIVANLTHYKEEPGRAAYYGIMDAKRRFLERKGSSGGGDFNSPRTEILRNYKAALRYGDAESAKKLLAMFEKAGGKSRGMKQSLDAMKPLAGLSKADKAEFIQSMTPEQKQDFDKATAYYEKVLANR